MIRSAQFDDIYFSPDDGLAETMHVFLQGNNLPAAWDGQDLFTVAETGFGTGLNFLSAWKLFDETAGAPATLDFVSFEKFPLHTDQIRAALSGWSDYFGGRLQKMLAAYPLRVNGFHRLHLSNRVRLTLIFDDVNDALLQLVVPRGVNAWFLDGFAPAKNPQMWSDILFREMKRLSAIGATVASFTAAGHVRRGLAAQGFTVSKARGYGRKRDMTKAVFGLTDSVTVPAAPRSIAVLGAGLAGTACSYALKRRGLSVTLFDSAGIAQFASGNPRGLYNPRFSQSRTPESDVYTSGYAALAALNMPERRCGSLHLVTDDDKRKRFQGFQKNWGWHEDHVCWLSSEEASEQAGIKIDHEALFLPDSGYFSPVDLCHLYAADIDIKKDQPDYDQFDAIILANGIQALQHPLLQHLPLHTVRGQISFLKSQIQPEIKSNICYGGYLAAGCDGSFVAGSTFQQWRTDTDVTAEDHNQILDNLYRAVPALAGNFEATGGRTSLRCAANDRFPVIGPVEGDSRYYVSTAHGSHGLVTALAGAEYLADCLMGTVWSLSAASSAALDPSRFKRRLQKNKEKKGLS